MLLLDTNVVSELRKIAGGRAHPNVVAWNEAIDPAETFIATVVLHELEIGVRLAEYADRAEGKVLRNWLDHVVVPAFGKRILPLDEAAALKAAEWHVPNPRPINDAYIAAIALTRHMTLVTRNVRDFQGMGIPVVNPWEFSASAYSHWVDDACNIIRIAGLRQIAMGASGFAGPGHISPPSVARRSPLRGLRPSGNCPLRGASGKARVRHRALHRADGAACCGVSEARLAIGIVDCFVYRFSLDEGRLHRGW
jgi:predicted nucleic acid-binding protein